MFPWGFSFGYWWIFPIIMIAMMALCFLVMRGCGAIMCMGGRSEHASDRPLDILNRKHARGDITKKEYDEKKEDIAR